MKKNKCEKLVNSLKKILHLLYNFELHDKAIQSIINAFLSDDLKLFKKEKFEWLISSLSSTLKKREQFGV